MPEGSQDVCDGSSRRHLRQKSPGTLCTVFADARVIPGKGTHYFGCHVLERELEAIRVFDESGKPSLRFVVHDAIVVCVAGLSQVCVLELALAGPVLCYWLERINSVDDMADYYSRFLPINGRYSIEPWVLLESNNDLITGRSEFCLAFFTSKSSMTFSSETTRNLAPSMSVM